MKRFAIAVAISLIAAGSAGAQTAADSAAIRATALNYVEGWYAGDAARMEKSLHPDLAKRIVQNNAEGVSRLGHQGAETLIGYTKGGGGKNTPAAQQIKDVKILDIFRNTASVRAEMSGWIDYMHIAKWNGEWKIVNVLWETKPRS
jgi:hypothetical protein